MAAVLYCLKSKNKVQLEFSSGHAKIKYGWGFKLLEMLKYGMIGVLYCSKKYKVRLGFSFIERSKVMYCSGFILLKMLKYGTARVLMYLKI